MANEDIRKLIFDSKVRMWEVAKEYGVTDATFSRKLRVEFSKEKKTKIKTIIENLKNCSK